MIRHLWCGALAVASAIAVGGAALAQAYPSRPIDLVVPFPPGGTTDTIARLIAQRFADNWPQPAIIANRPGGGSTIGTATVAKAAPDGHTLLVSTIGFAINATLMKPPYDAVRDFAPITELTSIPLMLVVHSSLPVNDLKGFIAYVKAQPGGVDYASSGSGTSPHLAAEMFKTMTGANLIHVPYKGNAEVSNALLGGHVKVHFGLVPPFMPHVKSGTLKVLAVTSEKRLPSMPGGADHRRTGLPGLRDRHLAGAVRACGHAYSDRRQDQRRDGRDAQRAGRARAADPRGRDARGQHAGRLHRAGEGEIDKWAKVIKASGLGPK